MMRPMISSDERRALRGCLQQLFYHFPNKLLILAAIAGSVIIYNNLIKYIQGSSSFLPVSFLTIGFVIVAGLLLINAFFEGESRNLKTRFAFPINRKIYLLAVFIAMLHDTAGLLMATTICTAVEMLMVKVTKMFQPGLIIINTIGMTDYWAGFWLSFSIIAFCYALCFVFSIYLAKARVKTPIVLGVVLVLVTSRYFHFGIDGFFLKLVTQGVASSLAVFYVEIWLLTIVAYLLAYLPLRRMEV